MFFVIATSKQSINVSVSCHEHANLMSTLQPIFARLRRPNISITVEHIRQFTRRFIDLFRIANSFTATANATGRLLTLQYAPSVPIAPFNATGGRIRFLLQRLRNETTQTRRRGKRKIRTKNFFLDSRTLCVLFVYWFGVFGKLNLDIRILCDAAHILNNSVLKRIWQPGNVSNNLEMLNHLQLTSKNLWYRILIRKGWLLIFSTHKYDAFSNKRFSKDFNAKSIPLFFFFFGFFFVWYWRSCVYDARWKIFDALCYSKHVLSADIA